MLPVQPPALHHKSGAGVGLHYMVYDSMVIETVCYGHSYKYVCSHDYFENVTMFVFKIYMYHCFFTQTKHCIFTLTSRLIKRAFALHLLIKPLNLYLVPMYT